uniref:Uncharacterized protein n=1 Tax=Anopheles minimus TaxID=112268 RepID=A0A182WPM4_9DIPT
MHYVALHCTRSFHSMHLEMLQKHPNKPNEVEDRNNKTIQHCTFTNS